MIYTYFLALLCFQHHPVTNTVSYEENTYEEKRASILEYLEQISRILSFSLCHLSSFLVFREKTTKYLL